MSQADTDHAQTRRPQLSIGRLRVALPLLAVALALLALWLAYNGWRQWQDESRSDAVLQSRDLAVQTTQRALQQETQRLRERLAYPDAQSALAAGNLSAAATQLGLGWPQLEQAQVWPPDLQAAYRGLPQSGFGRLAVAEAALVANAPVVRIVKEAGGARLVLAAPARTGGRLAGIAYVRLPLAIATGGLDALNVGETSYLALRQGTYTVHERGDPALGTSAEALAAKVPGTELRIVAALPDAARGVFGLGATAALIAAAVLAGLALLAWVAWRRGSDDSTAVDNDTEAEPTLAQTMQQAPLPNPVPVVEVKEAPKAAPVKIDRGIFRAYDIRGVVGVSLDAGVAELIGQAVGSLMVEKGLHDIVVGRDGRLSGPELVTALTQGLRKAGCNVIDIGLAPTPLVYFGTFHLRTGCGVAVTGSHNPPDYNGFKIVVGGETLSGDAILALHTRIAEDRLHQAATPGTLSQREIGDDYVARIADDVQIDRRLRVVVDAGNGVAGLLGPRVLEAVGADVTPLFCEIDGTFPNHHPDPSEAANLQDLVRMVDRLDADLGLAFDGDGDRLGVVTRDGENIYADRLLMLFAADVLERNPGAMIVYDVKSTGRLAGHILRHGGSPLMWKTGHSLIKAKMRETGAELAGEMSGHFFFAERWYGFDDGIYAAARLLEILAARPESPSEQLKALPKGMSTAEIKVDAPNGDPHAFVEHFRAMAKFEGGRLSTIDGLRMDWNDGWGLVRASNTTPVIVLRFDADSAEALARIQDAFRAQLLASKPDLVLPF